MISIILPTFNCKLYISNSINSILNQSYKNFEFLIIDDGSTDGTQDLVKNFSDRRIKYIRNDHQGLSKSLNFGLRIAQYDLIARMDADDIAHPKRIEMQLSKCSGEKNQIIFTNAAFFRDNKILYTLESKNDSKFINHKIALHGHFTHSSAIYNRNFILEQGGYNEKINVYEDYDLWLRIKNATQFSFVNEHLLFVRIRDNSLSNKSISQNHLIYNLQKPYYENLDESFNLFNPSEQIKIRGWREYFYGNKEKSRKYWMKSNLGNWDFRILAAYILSFLPKNFLNKITDRRFRLRLHYKFDKIFRGNKIQKDFDKILHTINPKLF